MTDRTPPTIDDTTTIDDVDLATDSIYVNGERLTVERADRIAADVLADVRRRNLIPGGKSLSGASKHSPVVQTRVPEAIHAKLQALAEAQNISVSKLLRRAIDTLVEGQ